MSLASTTPTVDAKQFRQASLLDILVYAQGDCAISLVMNGIFGFAMLYYTNALGLSPAWAGIAMSVSVFWEAISEPVMGHISDNTRSRWGRRHQYMLVGGLLMTICSYCIWAVPAALRGSQVQIFWYLVGINLLLRSGLTMFFIPYVALGFEMTSDYQGRSRVQGLRQIFNMAANFAGPAMAWAIFFHNRGKVQGTSIAANYLHMGAVFAAATGVFVLFVVVFTFWRHEDTRNLPREHHAGGLRNFFLDMRQIVMDPFPRWVFIFILIVCFGMVIVSSLQMYVYGDFMKFSADQKTIAHGGTMVAMALGALVSMPLARRFDKKGAVIVGGFVSVLSSAGLGALFLTGLVPVTAVSHIGGTAVPTALVLFVLGQGGYWFGNGIMLPISTAMMADVSEIHRLKTGVSKDGAYSSVYSLAMRLAIALALIAAGYCLSGIGYHTETIGHAPQSAATIWRLGAVTFIAGAAIGLIAVTAIFKYPITRRRLEELRRRAADAQQQPKVI